MIIKELIVARIYLEHAVCKVMQLSKKGTIRMLKKKELQRV
jgi:hypothetical protein